MSASRFIAMAAMFLSPLALHATDPFLGKWTLDVHRSRYPVGACPTTMTIEMSSTEHGVHYHSESKLANGNRITADYTAEYDGRSVMVTGEKGMLLPVSLKRVGKLVVVATYKSGFDVVATSRRVISTDGRLMTITTTSHNLLGKTITNSGVYKRTDSSRSTLDRRFQSKLLAAK